MKLTKESKNAILQYLKMGEEIARAPGYVLDHKTEGYTRDELVAYTDGKYEWTSEDIYNLKVNDEIFDEKLFAYILNR